MFHSAALFALAFSAITYGQQIGTLTTETHPALTISKCTTSGCTTEQKSVVLDANWRWVHETTGSTNCYTGNTWNSDVCGSDPVACAKVGCFYI